jgi:hypothetical protein
MLMQTLAQLTQFVHESELVEAKWLEMVLEVSFVLTEPTNQ